MILNINRVRRSDGSLVMSPSLEKVANERIPTCRSDLVCSALLSIAKDVIGVYLCRDRGLMKQGETKMMTFSV